MATAQIVAVAMQKGGVGKTTTTAALGAALALRGQRVLLVDFDPQASLTESVGGEPDAAIPELLTQLALTGQFPHSALPDLIQGGVGGLTVGALDLLPAHRNLATGDVRWYHADRSEAARDSQVLYMLLNEYRGWYDWIVIDSPPALGLLTVNVLAAAHLLVVPVSPEAGAIHGFHRLDLTLHEMRRFGINRGLRVAGILPCRLRWAGGHLLRQHAASLQGITAIAGRWQTQVFGAIPDAAVVLEAAAASVPIPVYAPQSRAALAYLAVADQLCSTKEIPGAQAQELVHAARG